MKATGTQQTLDQAEVFVDLLLGDDDLMRAEFDALIAACWESPCEPARRRPCSTPRGMGRPATATVAAPARHPTRSGAAATA